jgi:hypothetical protein
MTDYITVYERMNKLNYKQIIKNALISTFMFAILSVVIFEFIYIALVDMAN